MKLVRQKEFWVTVVAVAMVIVEAYFPSFPLTGEQVLGIILPLVAFIIGSPLTAVALQMKERNKLMRMSMGKE